MAFSKNTQQNEANKFVEIEGNDTAVRTINFNNLVTEPYDYISLGYTGDNLTSVVYKNGGSTGTTVATLTLGYSGSTLVSVAKS